MTKKAASPKTKKPATKSSRQETRVEEPEVLRVFQRRGTVQLLILLNDGARRASEIDQAFPFIARQVLGKRLSELERLGLVNRTVSAGPPIVSRYSLTSDGRKLSRVALELNGYLEADHIKPLHVPRAEDQPDIICLDPETHRRIGESIGNLEELSQSDLIPSESKESIEQVRVLLMELSR